MNSQVKINRQIRQAQLVRSCLMIFTEEDINYE